MNKESGNQILGLISKEIQSSTALQQPEIVKAQECTAHDKELLFENFLGTHAYTHSQAVKPLFWINQDVFSLQSIWKTT